MRQGETDGKEDLSTAQKKTETQERFPGEDENAPWPQGLEEQKGQRQEKVGRLSKSLRIRMILREGRKQAGGFMTSYDLLGGEKLSAAFIVSKKHGGAVVRNRIKRRLREAFRSAAKGFKGSAEFVFIPRNWKEGAKIEDLTQEIAKFIADAGLGSN